MNPFLFFAACFCLLAVVPSPEPDFHLLSQTRVEQKIELVPSC